MNRKERREQERMLARENKQAERYAQMVIEREKVRKKHVMRIEQNGITIDDLEKEYKRGYDKGFNEAAEPMYKYMMAAICLALRELHRWGEKRILRVLQCVDEKVIYALSTDEIVEEVLDKTGIEILFQEPFDRVKEKA